MTRSANKISNYATSRTLVFQVDSAGVLTTTGQGGLNRGKHVGTIKVGTSADDNLYTITFKHAFGLIPTWWFSPITTDLTLREDGTVIPTKSAIAFRAIKASDLTTHVTDGKFYVYVVGTSEIREGDYA